MRSLFFIASLVAIALSSPESNMSMVVVPDTCFGPLLRLREGLALVQDLVLAQDQDLVLAQDQDLVLDPDLVLDLVLVLVLILVLVLDQDLVLGLVLGLVLAQDPDPDLVLAPIIPASHASDAHFKCV